MTYNEEEDSEEELAKAKAQSVSHDGTQPVPPPAQDPNLDESLPLGGKKSKKRKADDSEEEYKAASVGQFLSLIIYFQFFRQFLKT